MFKNISHTTDVFSCYHVSDVFNTKKSRNIDIFNRLLYQTESLSKSPCQEGEWNVLQLNSEYSVTGYVLFCIEGG